MPNGARALRIAVWHNLPAGGAKRALVDHVRALVARGHYVEAWCPPSATQTFMPLGEFVPEHVVGIPDKGEEPPWEADWKRGQFKSPRAVIKAHSEHARECAAQMHAQRFDVCFGNTCRTFGSPPIARHFDGPTVLYLQEPHRVIYEANPLFPWIGTRIPVGFREHLLYPMRSLTVGVRSQRLSERARFEIENAHAFDRVLVNSLYSRETVLRTYGLEADVCYLGVDASHFRRNDVPRERMVAGVGSLLRTKRAHRLVEAVSMVKTERPRIEWVAASEDADYAAELRAQARREGIDLVIHRDASDDLLVDVLSRARALIFATRLEPFGLVPLEASACELPVIGAAEGGIRETVIDGVNGVMTDGSPEQLANAIDDLLQDPGRADQMGRAGRRLVEEQWTLDAAVDRLETALLDTVQGYPGP